MVLPIIIITHHSYHHHRHWGKFTCVGITIGFLAACGIAAAVCWPKLPTATLDSQSNMRISGLGVEMDMTLTVDNKNPYAGK